jgi:hypothetical protein
MPELVNSSVGSLPGTKLDERTTEWPFDSKKRRNLSRISDAFMMRDEGMLHSTDWPSKSWRLYPSGGERSARRATENPV